MTQIAIALLTVIVPSLALAIPSQDPVAGFDWSLLQGTWAESTNHQFACRQSNLHQRLLVSEDKSTLTFKNDRAWTIGTGKVVEEYSASIIRSAENLLIIRYNGDLSDVPEEFREWEVRFIGPGTYRWRATAWREGTYNQVIGIKCSSP